ncbi:MAG: hypothetical protein K0Q77_2376 [Anaerosporomusa subterranea]|jgi:hypothetical protein|nr:hypothetical protein [Anaerosporomusa subterranea]
MCLLKLLYCIKSVFRKTRNHKRESVRKCPDARNSEACAAPRTKGTQASKRSRDNADGRFVTDSIRVPVQLAANTKASMKQRIELVGNAKARCERIENQGALSCKSELD